MDQVADLTASRPHCAVLSPGALGAARRAGPHPVVGCERSADPVELAEQAPLVLIAITTVLYYEVLRGLGAWLPRLPLPNHPKLLVVVFSAMVAHSLEIAVYGVWIFALGQFTTGSALTGPAGFSFANCLYFSAETFTSLGFGDLTPVGPVRLLAGVEALNGLALIGWSASYIFLSMERFWVDAPNRLVAADPVSAEEQA